MDSDYSSEEEPELETLNISNDHYYDAPKSLPQEKQQETVQGDSIPNLVVVNHNNIAEQIPKYGSKTIRHSLPAYDLWRPFFPTYLSDQKFRDFHRPKLRHYNTGPQARSRRGAFRSFPVKNLTRHIYRSQKQLRLKVIKAINNGSSREEISKKLLLINKAQDLTAKSGELYFFEYCEQFPPVLGQIGMAINIKTLVQPSESALNRGRPKPAASQSDGSTEPGQHDDNIGFREVISKNKNGGQVYFSQLKPGATLRVIENNLYRAPIFRHQFSNCDFLLIRTRNSFYIRPVRTIFSVGQTMPLIPIPLPTNLRIHKFRCDLSNLYINKLFKESETEPSTIRIDMLTKMFPDYSPCVLKRRMKMNGAVRCQTSSDPNIFEQGHSNYGVATTLELRSSFYPEHYCLNMATLAARQRLRELNYTETMIDPPIGTELETEVLAAPWNTSKAIVEARAGRAYLDLKPHLIDPTNPCKEGFSCISWVKSPTAEEQAKAMKEDAQKSQTNTDGQQPRQFLDKNPMAVKIQREKLERLAIYQKEAQFITEQQSRSLASTEVMSSADEDSEDEDSENNVDFERQYNDLDKLIMGCRTVSELNYEKEEEERRQLLAELNKPTNQPNQSNTQQLQQQQQQPQLNGDTHKEKTGLNLASIKGKILKITRTYRVEPEGEIQRTEIVREPRVIALYIKKMGDNLSNHIMPGPDPQTAGDSLNHLHNSSLHDISISSTRSDGVLLQSQQYRSRSNSLGPSELCRADGTILTISKKVLESSRKVRACRRDSMYQ